MMNGAQHAQRRITLARVAVVAILAAVVATGCRKSHEPPCPIGSFVDAGDACQPCGDGSFSTLTNAAACQPFTACQPGQHVAAEGTSTSDRTCAECAAGTFSDAENLPACTAWSRHCVPGELVSAAPSATSDTQCLACPDGTFSAEEDAPACAPWTLHCAAGEFVAAAPTATADTLCQPCESGWFSAGEDAAACAPWQTCPAGTFVANAPSGSEDRLCEGCAIGSFSAGVNWSACLPLEACPAGTEQLVPGTPVSPPVCQPCPAGTYCAGGETPQVGCAAGTWDHDASSASPCTAWTPCAANWYVTTPGSATTDQACAFCAGGLVCSGACVVGAQCCTACAASCTGTATECWNMPIQPETAETVASMQPRPSCVAQGCSTQYGRVTDMWGSTIGWESWCVGGAGTVAPCPTYTIARCPTVSGCSVRTPTCVNYRCQ